MNRLLERHAGDVRQDDGSDLDRPHTDQQGHHTRLHHIRRRVLLPLLAAATAAAVVLAALASPTDARPPRIPSESTARSELSQLTVKAEGSTAGYSRSLFPHWNTLADGCTVRQRVLIRDGTNVAVNSNCQPTSGRWFSAYDGVTLTSASSVDIDHVVPLAEAWKSGANTWGANKRRGFANNVTWPQLIAVSASSNRSKGARDPASWKPPRTAYHCTYSRMWIRVKHVYGLSLQSFEKSALRTMLNTC